ncbi:bone morphogenetic protein 2-like [Centruroides sculpturatus]|uniref:bone morphogenetic protein 2-like n=1 Tax=Centruroides sculpturatus TaxID=218467 RepID=UPI000C6ECE84|nr:bone morphogenetic protein 2-like [Centruroides sculpturatus]
MIRIWLIYLNLVAVYCLSRTRINSNMELEAFKRMFLDNLNIRSEPDMSKVNISVEEMRRMLLMYYREEKLLKLSKYKSIVKHEEGELRKKLMFFLPQMSLSDLHSATLRLSIHPNNSGVLHLLHQNHLVNTLNLSTHRGEELDLFKIVGQWIEQPDSNQGLTLECASCQSIPTEATLHVVSHRRMKRQVKNRRSKCKRNYDCCLKKLKVNFKEIGWNWIYRPESFDFYYCKGKCRNDTSILSQNALIRSILRSRSIKVPRLCCAPKRTGSLRILHYTDSDPPKLVVRKLKGMVVKSCGCQ